MNEVVKTYGVVRTSYLVINEMFCPEPLGFLARFLYKKDTISHQGEFYWIEDFKRLTGLIPPVSIQDILDLWSKGDVKILIPGSEVVVSELYFDRDAACHLLDLETFPSGEIIWSPPLWVPIGRIKYQYKIREFNDLDKTLE